MRDLTYQSTDRPTEFWALKDVSFSLSKGEAIGVIGCNGAGKTTLLRILAGQVPPDSGSVRIVGRAEAMIDLTAGFNMSATGRENIYIRGCLLGRPISELKQKEQEIVLFSELDDAIDAPVATYSSGMVMRLAFSIIVATHPDVLIVDEVLAVGDFRFRQKCLGKIRELRSSSAFVLVSHSMGDIRTFCDRVIVLNSGRVAFEGNPDKAIEYYENLTETNVGDEGARRESVLQPQYVNESSILEIEHYWTNSEGRRTSTIGFGMPVRLEVRVRVSRPLRNPTVGVPIWTSGGDYVTGFSTQITGDCLSFTPGSLHRFCLDVPGLQLNPGQYYSNLSITDGPEFLYRKGNPTLTVTSSKTPYWGCVTLPHAWRQASEDGLQ